jgi:protein-disulfide isomerase
MLLRALALCFSLALTMAHPALAFDPAAMTEAERAAFRAEIRAYLIENPEVLVEAINELDARKAAAQAANDIDMVARNAQAIFDDGRSWIGGNVGGDVTLVEFVDYRCGYCKRAHAEVADLVQSDGAIRYVLKEFPILGEDSVLASRFAIAVRSVGGADVYWQMHDNLMNFRGDITQPALDRVALDLGLDPQVVRMAMDDPAVMAEIAANHELASALEISGTPTFVLQMAGGTQPETMLRGYLPQDQMQAVVAEIRSQ